MPNKSYRKYELLDGDFNHIMFGKSNEIAKHLGITVREVCQKAYRDRLYKGIKRMDYYIESSDPTFTIYDHNLMDVKFHGNRKECCEYLGITPGSFNCKFYHQKKAQGKRKLKYYIERDEDWEE